MLYIYICIVIYIFQDCEELGILHPKPSNLAVSRPQVLRSPLNVKPVRLEGRLGRNWGDGHVHMSIHVHSCSYKWGFPNDGGMTIIHMLLIQVCGIIAGARWNTRKVCCFWQTKNCNGTMVINCNTHRERLVGFGWSDSTMFTWSYGYGSIPIHTIFSGMNIHLLAILMFTRGTRFWPIPILVCLTLRNRWMLCEPEALHQFFAHLCTRVCPISGLPLCWAVLGCFPCLFVEKSSCRSHKLCHFVIPFCNISRFIFIHFNTNLIWIPTLGVIRLDNKPDILWMVLPFRKVWTHVKILIRLCRRRN